ncbi:MAG: sulfurtransferase TusA family protein [Candidatus Calescibacterium sp.]|jgi:tRNA 2-thiouridine synthesizing protein A
MDQEKEQTKVEINYNLEFDARGLKCPMPVIKVRKILQSLKPGEIILVLADDPGAKRDFPAFCAQTGDEIIKSEEENGVLKFYIKKRTQK